MSDRCEFCGINPGPDGVCETPEHVRACLRAPKAFDETLMRAKASAYEEEKLRAARNARTRT